MTSPTWRSRSCRTVSGSGPRRRPVGTHPRFRRLGLAGAMMLHGMRLARSAGATHATVACLGAPGIHGARELYYGLGFRELSRDAPLIKIIPAVASSGSPHAATSTATGATGAPSPKPA